MDHKESLLYDASPSSIDLSSVGPLNCVTSAATFTSFAESASGIITACWLLSIVGIASAFPSFPVTFIFEKEKSSLFGMHFHRHHCIPGNHSYLQS
jgi:hypothetical protein